MTKEKYNSIRNLPNFLHLYFIEETGKGIAQAQFDQAFHTWLMAVVGMHPMQGIQQINNYLDQKFA
jgi:hypothetical protein